MKKTLVAKLALAGTLGLVAAMAATSASAADCSACHTMHNSQNGDPMRGPGLTTPLPKLLLNDCIGCHTGQNTAGSLTTQQPEVYSGTVAPTYGTAGNNTLAGGNFYWPTQAGSEDTGHNVAELGVADADLGNTPPGHTGALAQQLTCAGVYGCHGERTAGNEIPLESLHGSHHFAHNDINDALSAPATVGASFRYLYGVEGREDSNWEFANSDAAHNLYKGQDRTGANETVAADGTTISALCGQCHGAFHREGNDAFGIVEDAGAGADTIGTGQWIRHPTDYGMPNAGEYAGYNAYRVLTPVGTTDIATDSTLNLALTTDRVVLCVSCHRAHGSPYADALRWNYATMQTGNGGAAAGTGCFACHTNKD